MIEELHTQIEAVQSKLRLADRAGRLRDASLYRARLEDLMDMAARHDVDVSAWVDRSLLQQPRAEE